MTNMKTDLVGKMVKTCYDREENWYHIVAVWADGAMLRVGLRPCDKFGKNTGGRASNCDFSALVF